jgi:thiol:disulfide interchange protein DsbD
LWIYAQQTSMDSAFALLFAFLMLIAFIWALCLPKGMPRMVVSFIFALSLGAAYALWMCADEANAQPVAPAALAGAQATPAGLGAWSNWTPEVQAAARTAGRPVFVDFTAAWCLTCQVNKSSTLKHADIEAAFKAKNVLLLRADWTKPNSAIAAELAQLGRSGLPVYALYLPGSTAPQLLPEVLTKSIILDALSVL